MKKMLSILLIVIVALGMLTGGAVLTAVCVCAGRKYEEKSADCVIVLGAHVWMDAVELLSESRELERTGKELADEAKAVLDREVRKQGIKSVRAGNLILVLNEIKSSRLDTTALKKAHPELISEFMKQSSSVRYDLKEVA